MKITIKGYGEVSRKRINDIIDHLWCKKTIKINIDGIKYKGKIETIEYQKPVQIINYNGGVTTLVVRTDD